MGPIGLIGLTGASATRRIDWGFDNIFRYPSSPREFRLQASSNSMTEGRRSTVIGATLKSVRGVSVSVIGARPVRSQRLIA